MSELFSHFSGQGSLSHNDDDVSSFVGFSDIRENNILFSWSFFPWGEMTSSGYFPILLLYEYRLPPVVSIETVVMMVPVMMLWLVDSLWRMSDKRNDSCRQDQLSKGIEREFILPFSSHLYIWSWKWWVSLHGAVDSSGVQSKIVLGKVITAIPSPACHLNITSCKLWLFPQWICEGVCCVNWGCLR